MVDGGAGLLTPAQVFAVWWVCRPSSLAAGWVGGWRQRRTRAFSAAKRLLQLPWDNCCVGRTAVYRLQHATQVYAQRRPTASAKAGKQCAYADTAPGVSECRALGALEEEDLWSGSGMINMVTCAWGDSHQQTR
jgi:hypothetical protein